MKTRLVHIAPYEKGRREEVCCNDQVAAFTTLLDNKEVVMVEIQGTVEYRGGEGEEDGGMGKLGDLEWDKGKARAVLRVGHHRLIGQLQTLAQPFVVLCPREKMIDADDDIPALYEPGDAVWDIATVVKKKLVFNTRPEPISDFY